MTPKTSSPSLRGLLVAVAVALALPGYAQAPQGLSPGESPLPAHMPTAGMGGVKDAMKDGLQGAAQSAASAIKGAVPTALPAGIPGVGAAPPAAPGTVDPAVARADRIAALRRKTLKEDDFAENEDQNRDPFHSYVKLLLEKGPQGPGQKTPEGPPAIFDKYTLEELTLIAIVSGDANPRAMFRNPPGLGMTVKRGDYVSRTRARITKILSDRVVVELSEDVGAGPPRVLEKAILVNPDEAEAEAK